MSITLFVIALALASAFIVIVLALVVVIVYQRWRISDSNAHLAKFIDENQRLRRILYSKGITSIE